MELTLEIIQCIQTRDKSPKTCNNCPVDPLKRPIEGDWCSMLLKCRKWLEQEENKLKTQ